MKKYLLLFSLFIFPYLSFSQYKKYRVKSKKTEGLADYIRPFNFSGWYIAPGATLTPKLNIVPFSPDTEIAPFEGLDVTQKSKIGLYLEVGRYKLLSSKKLISYIDYGLAYKQLRGYQSYNLDHQIDAVNRDTTFHEQSFSLHNATAHFNANNVIGINKNFFIQNTLGVNVDYSFISNIKSSDATNFTSTYQATPSNLSAQIHYKFGMGFRISDGIYVIPMIETPVLNVWEFEGGRSTLGFFNSRYRPLIISLRIARLTKPSCPKTWDTQDSKNTGGRPDIW